MGSTGLLSGEMARRIKAIAPAATASSNDNFNNQLTSNHSNDVVSKESGPNVVSDWRMALYHEVENGNGNGIETGKIGSHLSSTSSLVTSLSSSREGSPDRHNVVPVFVPGPTSDVTSWIPIRPQVPLFSAWTDA